MTNDACFLEPTEILDYNHPRIKAHVQAVVGTDGNDPIRAASHLFLAARDGIRYDPYTPFYLPEHYRASNVLKAGRGFCVPKAALLCALGRAVVIPSRLGFADIRNYLAPPEIIRMLGTNLFVFHGYTEFYLAGRWIKATPAFNASLCQRQGVDPLTFDGRQDATLPEYNNAQEKFIEYVTPRGSYADVPLESIMTVWYEIYGPDVMARLVDHSKKDGAYPPDTSH